MKHILCLTLSLVLLAVCSARAESGGRDTLTCPELGFSAQIPAGLSANLNMEDQSVMVYLEEPGSAPNIWIHPREGKLNDPVSFMHEKYPDYMQEKYGDNLVMINRYEYYEIAGMKLNAVGFIYRDSNGNAVNQLNLVLPLETEDVEFRARYAPDGEDFALYTLEALIANYQPDPDYYSNPRPQAQQFQDQEPQPQQQPASGSAGAAQSFTVHDIRLDNMIIGRCTVPSNYTVQSQTSCCTRSQSIEFPWFLLVGAESPDGIGLVYCSPQTYFDNGSGTSQDGSYVSQYMMPALHYMNASEYCDFFVAGMNQYASGIWLVEENSFPELQSLLRQSADAYKNDLNRVSAGSGISVSQVERAMAMRVYYIESAGQDPYYFAVAVSTLGVWNELTGAFGTWNAYTVWNVPYIYAMICPASIWEANRDVFTVFSGNTSVTDQFLSANQRLSTDLLSIMTGIDLSGGSDYSKKILAEETSKGNDYNEERFSDYMFDQNDYTLSDGSHVKVSTAYDYVWTGSDGNVYYSNSALDMPSGATQLYPNR